MIHSYEVLMAESILRKAENQRKEIVKLHTKLTALLLKYPKRVYSVELRNSERDLCLQFLAHDEIITEGFSWIDFYSFEPVDTLEDKYKLACEFAKGAISFFPKERRS